MDIIISLLCGLSIGLLVMWIIMKSRIKLQQEYLQIQEKNHQKSLDELQKRFDETISRVSYEMKVQTGEMLKERQKEFAQSSESSLCQILNPLKEDLKQLKSTMDNGSREQAERNGEIKERIRILLEHSEAARKSADELASALKHGSKVQGDWGETILEELLNHHELVKGIHYDVQSTMRDNEGRVLKSDSGNMLRPDLILHLDEVREVIIDSKVSLSAYIDYVNAENAADRELYLKQHIESIRKHYKELAAKDYSSYIQAPKQSAGYVIMFVPNHGALWTALESDRELWRKAADMNVYICDEQSLFGALKIVRMTWTQLQQNQNHKQVYALAEEIINRVGQFMKSYEQIGKSLQEANGRYEEARKKLLPNGQSIITSANKLIQLGAKDSLKNPIKPYTNDGLEA